jgi:DNA-binding NtrC family response regulator
VLVVEDESRLRDLLRDVLPGMGFEPLTARTAEEAMHLMLDDGADIVVLDLNLPVTDGMTFLEQFRQRWPRTPVIIMTGFGSLESAKRAIHLGVVEFLTKPCHLGEIEQALERARRVLVEQVAATAEPLPETPQHAEPRTLAELERDAIMQALTRQRGNRSAAAAELGISRRTLYNKLAEYQKQGFEIE